MPPITSPVAPAKANVTLPFRLPVVLPVFSGARPVSVPNVPNIPLTAKFLERLAAMFRPRADRFEALLNQLSDDLYNSALINNPSAYVLMYGRAGAKSAADETATLIHENATNEPVVVYARAANAAGDVTALMLATNGGGAAGSVQAQVEGAVGRGPAAAVLLRPGAQLHATVRVMTSPATVIYTVMPLRGRAGVFGDGRR